MPAKLSEGDTVGMAGEVTIVHDDGSVTVRLHGFGTPIDDVGRASEPGGEKEARAGPTYETVRQPDQSGCSRASPAFSSSTVVAPSSNSNRMRWAMLDRAFSSTMLC